MSFDVGPGRVVADERVVFPEIVGFKAWNVVGDFDRDGLELTMIEVGVDLDEVGAALLAGDVDKANSILAQGQERLRRWGQEIQGD